MRLLTPEYQKLLNIQILSLLEKVEQNSEEKSFANSKTLLDFLWLGCGIGIKECAKFLKPLIKEKGLDLNFKKYGQIEFTYLGFFALGLLKTASDYTPLHLKAMHDLITDVDVDFNQPAIRLNGSVYTILDVINLYRTPQGQTLKTLKAARNWLIAYGATPQTYDSPIPLFESFDCFPVSLSPTTSSFVRHHRSLGSYIPLSPMTGDIWQALQYRMFFWRRSELAQLKDVQEWSPSAMSGIKLIGWWGQVFFKGLFPSFLPPLVAIIADYFFDLDELRQALRITPINGYGYFDTEIKGLYARSPSALWLCALADILTSVDDDEIMTFFSTATYRQGLSLKIWLIQIAQAITEPDNSSLKRLLEKVPDYQLDSKDEKSLVPITVNHLNPRLIHDSRVLERQDIDINYTGIKISDMRKELLLVTGAIKQDQSASLAIPISSL